MADPISSAVVAIAGWFGATAATAATIAAIATPLITIAAATAVAKALSPKKARGVDSSGTQLTFKADPQAGIPFVLGRTAVGGNLVFQYPSGSNNKFLNMFVALSGGGPVEAIESFTADKQAVTFNGGGSVTSGGSFAGKMWMIMALGLTPAAALATPTDLVSSGPVAEWTADHKLSGYAAARWALEYNADVYPSGIPQPQWVLKGLKVYDPRKDSTYPGGSGSHRADDPTTREYSECPYLNGLTYCLGYFSNGKRVGGVGIPVDLIDVASFVEGANVSDANGWKVGGQITSLDSKWGVLKAILQAGSGEPLQSGAKISCRVDTPRTSLATLTESDICGAVNVPAVRSRRDRKNSIIPRCRLEAQNWEIVPCAPVTSSVYQTEDGGLRQKEIEYTLVQDAGQAAVLAAYDLVNAREFEPITLAAKPAWQGFRPGDCLTLDLPEMGLNDQKAVIRSRDFDYATSVVLLTLVSETDAKHAFALGQTAAPPPTPGLTVPDFAAVPAPGVGVYAVAAGTSAETGQPGASLIVTGVCDYPFAAEVVVQIRVAGFPTFSTYASWPATATRMPISNLVDGAYYDVAIAYRSIFGITGPARIITNPAASVQPVVFTNVSDGDTLTIDPPLSGIPTVSVDMTGCLTPGVGEAQIYRLSGLSAAGASVELKLTDSTGTTAHQTTTGAIGAGGSTDIDAWPHYYADKPTTGDSVTRVYKFTVEVDRRQPAVGHSPFFSFAPLFIRPAGATSWGAPVGFAGGSSSGPVASPVQGTGSDTYVVFVTYEADIGQDAEPQFKATTSGNVGVVLSLTVEYDAEVTAATEVTATDATHKATVTFYPPDYVSGAGITGPAFDAPTAAALPLSSSGSTPDLLVLQDGVLQRVSLFPSRKTKDLQIPTQTLVDEVYPAYSDFWKTHPDGDGTGEVQISKGVLSLGLTGRVCPWLPPYNCKGDVRKAVRVASTNGADVVVADAPVFLAGRDEGKEVYLSNARSGFAAFGGSSISNRLHILAVVDAYTVQLDQNCTQTFSSNGMYWGTNDTVGFNAALAAIAPPSGDMYNLGGVLELGGRIYLVDGVSYPPRSAIVGPGGLVRRPGQTNKTLLANLSSTLTEASRMDDFPTIMNIDLDGMKYMQSAYGSGYGSNCFEWISVTGAYNLAQVDPFVKFSGIKIRDGSNIGYRDYGRGSGNLDFLTVTGCFSKGWQFEHYDMAVSNIQTQNNALVGGHFDGSNSVYTSCKGSYNGTNGNLTPETTSNFLISAHGCLFTDMMGQESFGPNITITGGNNEFHGQSQDAGDQFPVGEHGTLAKLPLQRAGVCLKGADCVDNDINLKVTPAVHATNYATHAVFFANDSGGGRPTYNYGSMRYHHSCAGNWYAGGVSDLGTTIPPGTGVYTAGDIGVQHGSGIHSTNHDLTLNGTNVV